MDASGGAGTGGDGGDGGKTIFTFCTEVVNSGVLTQDVSGGSGTNSGATGFSLDQGNAFYCN